MYGIAIFAIALCVTALPAAVVLYALSVRDDRRRTLANEERAAAQRAAWAAEGRPPVPARPY